MSMKTKDKLVQALQKAQAPEDMIERAKAGYYDELESTLESPIQQLVWDAQAVGLFKISDRAMADEFSATDEETDAWLRRRGIFDELKQKGISPFDKD